MKRTKTWAELIDDVRRRCFPELYAVRDGSVDAKLQRAIADRTLRERGREVARKCGLEGM